MKDNLINVTYSANIKKVDSKNGILANYVESRETFIEINLENPNKSNYSYSHTYDFNSVLDRITK